MYTLTIDQNKYVCQFGDSVLDALLRENINLSFACKKGTCHSCMIRSADVTPPTSSPIRVKEHLNKSELLSCLPVLP